MALQPLKTRGTNTDVAVVHERNNDFSVVV